jgi:hypothetical protein
VTRDRAITNSFGREGEQGGGERDRAITKREGEGERERERERQRRGERDRASTKREDEREGGGGGGGSVTVRGQRRQVRNIESSLC